MDSPEQTNMTNPPVKQTKMVKIRAKHPIRITKQDNGRDIEHIIQPGETAEVSEAEAKEFCDKKITLGYKDTFGNVDRATNKPKSVIRAERIK